ncbi:MAG: Fe-S cluster assembly protein HesB [Gammaproteobacteria bacterium]|jgi:iron-sulfur cluster assembly protein|nr:Fe-S cluster assembly protein HesB [Gammaproteobacteria bacterium]MBT7603941.1 Fe-S cluster assembly protein HesB [Gammaproteobacteria bacterium]
MINITNEAATIIKQEIEKKENKGFKLRIAVMKKEDNSLHYVLGFDDNYTNNDKIHKSNELEIIISNSSLSMCDGMTLDYVELEKNKFNFIFLNPKDPNYVKPTE